MKIFRGLGILSVILAGTGSSLLACGIAAAAELTVPMDEVRMITFRTPVKTVFVGNPLIADVTVVDATRIFILGKNFGTTNLVALDDAGRQIVNDRITVLGRTGSIVTLQRGRAQTTLACAGARCQVAPQPGDDAESFGVVADQINSREADLRAAASAAGAQ